jgi:isopentenyldiphosphate isomerase
MLLRIDMVVQQNDPSELLEVFDSRGRATGRARSRAAIHLAGDWHQAFHCWILRRSGQQIVMQRRSFLKDTFANCWDAAAAGHWRFGESACEAAREIAEELGIAVPFERLVYYGRERSSRQFPNGLTDRELHEVYVLHDDRPLWDYQPNPLEVSGLAAFASADLVAMAAGAAIEAEALEAVSVDADGSLAPSEVTVRRDDLVPYSAARLRRMIGRNRAH